MSLGASLNANVPQPMRITCLLVGGVHRRFVDVDDVVSWLRSSVDRLTDEGRSVVNELISKLDSAHPEVQQL